MNKIFIPCLQVAIISCAISISISQFFLFATFILYLFKKDRSLFCLTPISLLPLGFFGFYLLSFVYHFSTMSELSFTAALRTSEIKDILLFAGFIVVQNLKNQEEINRIEKAFWILLVVLLISGFISIFSPIRLSRLVTDIIKPSLAWKFSHHYGNIFGLGIHLPIGFMNTHLTYGGIFVLFAPYVFFRFLFSIRDRKNIIFHFFILFLYGIILLLNNARSAMFGGLISICIGFIDLLFIQKYFSLKNTVKLMSAPILIIGLLLGILFLNETTAKTIQPLLGQEKHTDSGRTFIWSSTFPMIFANPILGISPGNYAKEIEITRKQLSIDYQDLLYFFEVTQRGHAHNDFLHIAAIAGLPAMIFYLLLGMTITYYLLQVKQSRTDAILFYGLVGFFFAGLFQCYFQDDEVVIVFWYLLGFFHLQLQNRTVNEKNCRR